MLSDNSDNTVHITREMLQDFASMKKTWFDFWSTKSGEGKMEVAIEDSYAMDLDDLYGVLQRCDIGGKSALSFCISWFAPLMDNLYFALCLDDLFGPEPASISGYRMVNMPETEEDLMIWIIRKMYDVYDGISIDSRGKTLDEYLNIRDMIQQIEWFTEDEGLPVEDRRYIDEIKNDFLMQYDNDLILKDAPEGIRELFRMYCDELAAKKDMNALRIKGYACYGGNSIYECDWQTAADCMEILWKEGSFGYAANTLGYIYYYGRLSNGVPDYEKAFYYYSVGNTYGIVESGYKLADMFMNGYYVKKNYDMAYSIIDKFYTDCRYRFEQGEFEGHFADVALRMGKLLLLNKDADEGNRFHAYLLFLQAEFALTMRMLESRQYGDNQVMKNIRKCLEDTCDVVEHRKKTFNSPFPYPIFELIGAHSYCIYNLQVKQLKKGIKITVIRNARQGTKDYDYSLITYPEFSMCDLTDTVTVTAEDVIYASEPPAMGECLFDTFSTSGDGVAKTYNFYFCGKCVYSICANNYRIKLPHK